MILDGEFQQTANIGRSHGDHDGVRGFRIIRQHLFNDVKGRLPFQAKVIHHISDKSDLERAMKVDYSTSDG